MRKNSSKNAVTTSFKNRVKFGISAFKDSKDASINVSKTDVLNVNRQCSPNVIEYGLDQVQENEEIELKIPNVSGNNSEMRRQEPRENIKVVKIMKDNSLNIHRRDLVPISHYESTGITKMRPKITVVT